MSGLSPQIKNLSEQRSGRVQSPSTVSNEWRKAKNLVEMTIDISNQDDDSTISEILLSEFSDIEGENIDTSSTVDHDDLEWPPISMVMPADKDYNYFPPISAIDQDALYGSLLRLESKEEGDEDFDHFWKMSRRVAEFSSEMTVLEFTKYHDRLDTRADTEMSIEETLLQAASSSIKKLEMTYRNILNRLVANNIEYIVERILVQPYNTLTEFRTLVNLVAEFSIESVKFQSIYVDFIKDLLTGIQAQLHQNGAIFKADDEHYFYAVFEFTSEYFPTLEECKNNFRSQFSAISYLLLKYQEYFFRKPDFKGFAETNEFLDKKEKENSVSIDKINMHKTRIQDSMEVFKHRYEVLIYLLCHLYYRHHIFNESLFLSVGLQLMSFDDQYSDNFYTIALLRGLQEFESFPINSKSEFAEESKLLFTKFVENLEFRRSQFKEAFQVHIANQILERLKGGKFTYYEFDYRIVDLNLQILEKSELNTFREEVNERIKPQESETIFKVTQEYSDEDLIAEIVTEYLEDSYSVLTLDFSVITRDETNFIQPILSYLKDNSKNPIYSLYIGTIGYLFEQLAEYDVKVFNFLFRVIRVAFLNTVSSTDINPFLTDTFIPKLCELSTNNPVVSRHVRAFLLAYELVYKESSRSLMRHILFDSTTIEEFSPCSVLISLHTDIISLFRLNKNAQIGALNTSLERLNKFWLESVVFDLLDHDGVKRSLSSTLDTLALEKKIMTQVLAISDYFDKFFGLSSTQRIPTTETLDAFNAKFKGSNRLHDIRTKLDVLDLDMKYNQVRFIANTNYKRILVLFLLFSSTFSASALNSTESNDTKILLNLTLDIMLKYFKEYKEISMFFDYFTFLHQESGLCKISPTGLLDILYTQAEKLDKYHGVEGLLMTYRKKSL